MVAHEEGSWCASKGSGNGPITVEAGCDWFLCCWQVGLDWKTFGSPSTSSAKSSVLNGVSQSMMALSKSLAASEPIRNYKPTEAADFSRGSVGPVLVSAEYSLLPLQPTVQQQEEFPADAMESHDL